MRHLSLLNMDEFKSSLNPNAHEFNFAPQSPCYSSSTMPQYNSTIEESTTTPIQVTGVVGPPPTDSLFRRPPQYHSRFPSPATEHLFGAPWGSHWFQPRPMMFGSSYRPYFGPNYCTLRPFENYGPPLQQPPRPWDSRFQSWPGIIPSQTHVGVVAVAHRVEPQTPIASAAREHVSRAILVNGMPPCVTDVQLTREMQQWGDVRAVDSGMRRDGLVTVAFYDIRHAEKALRDIQQQHLDKQKRVMQQFHRSGNPGRCHSTDSPPAAASAKGLVYGFVMWAQFALPVGAAAGPEGQNQGTLVVLNLNAETTVEHLISTFGDYGDVKEIRETPSKKRHKFVEFYDVRDASKAREALDGTEIDGNCVKIEFSRPGGNPHKAHVQPH